MRIQSVIAIPLFKMQELCQLSSDCYSTNFHEGFKNWLSKVLARRTLSLYAEEGDEAIGYIIAFPYNSSLKVPLNGMIEEEFDEDCVYIHDIGVKMNFRNQGVARKLIECLFDKIRGNGLKICLISVQDTVGFWKKFGFKVVSEEVYGGEKSYRMEREAII